MTDKILIDRALLDQVLDVFAKLDDVIYRYYQPVEYLVEAEKALRTALEQPDMGNLSSAPEGWKLVPVEPTQVMMDAMQLSGWLPGCYRAMLAAAPQPPVVKDSSTTHQAQPKRDPLSDEQILKLGWAVTPYANQMEMLSIARAIERAHGIGGEE